jgi:hypothetical protein
VQPKGRCIQFLNLDVREYRLNHTYYLVYYKTYYIYIRVLYSMACCGMMWYGMVWYGVAWHGMAWYDGSVNWSVVPN